MNFRRRRKRSGRKRKHLLDLGIKLGGGGEQAVVTASGFGGHAVGDLFLHHQDQRVEILPVFEQAQQDVGSDEVREVSYDAGWRGFVFDAGTRVAGLGSEDGVKIDGEDV